MYNLVASYDYTPYNRACSPPVPRPGSISKWTPNTITHRDYNYPSQISEQHRNREYGYVDSEPLAYPESSQRTFVSDSSLRDAVNVNAALPPRDSRQQSTTRRSLDSRSADSTTYSSALQEPPPYEPIAQSAKESLRKSRSRVDNSTPSMSHDVENMFTVFCTDTAHPSKSGQTDSVPSTFTFQLGPGSMNQIDDPRAMEDDESQEYDREGGVMLEVMDVDGSCAPLPKLQPVEPMSGGADGRPLDPKPSRPGSAKRSKMHQCNICSKWFPRPSGLATHLNSHNGLRPYECPLPTCKKSFAVRSNAKRHMRTHGIVVTSDSRESPVYTVGFDTPVISEVHEMDRLPRVLRWIPQSLTSLSMIGWSRPFDSDNSGDDGCPVLPVPLLPSISPVRWSSQDTSDEHVTSPYHPQNWRGLPGPALPGPTP